MTTKSTNECDVKCLNCYVTWIASYRIYCSKDYSLMDIGSIVHPPSRIIVQGK